MIFMFSCVSDKNEKTNENSQKVTKETIIFKKQGYLSFLNSEKQQITSIDIEIADNEFTREKGLMYRRSMDENQGMLFIFESSAERYFWMKNTYIPLDIIYVNEKKEIVSIQKSAIPLSEESLPSFKDAMYVVEVNAGFTDKFKINSGYFIDFKID